MLDWYSPLSVYKFDEKKQPLTNQLTSALQF